MNNLSENNLNAIIKLRHLSKLVKTNWKMLAETSNTVTNIIEETGLLMNAYGSDFGKSQYKTDTSALSKKIAVVQGTLSEFYEFITNDKKIESEKLYNTFVESIAESISIFKKIGNYSQEYLTHLNPNEWKDIWNVVLSHVYIIQGVGEAAYMRVNMMKNFNEQETDLLTKQIVKHIPESFTLLEAEKYKNEYLQAAKEIEEESNKNDNLWDRFLNVLAGSIPFKQTPEERVMMSRWIEGEKGDL